MFTLTDKYFRVFEVAAKGSYGSSEELSKAVAGAKFDEFSFKLAGNTRYTDAKRIEPMSIYLNEIALLKEYKVVGKNKSKANDRARFKEWLGDEAQNYLQDTWKCSIDSIQQKAGELLRERTPRLPTPKNIYRSLIQKPKSQRFFEDSLRVLAVQKPDLFALNTRLVLTKDDILKP